MFDKRVYSLTGSFEYKSPYISLYHLLPVILTVNRVFLYTSKIVYII